MFSFPGPEKLQCASLYCKLKQMSVNEKITKADNSASPLQLSDCYSSVSVMMEEAAATPDFTAACPVPGTAASPKHTSTDSAGQRARGAENSLNRRNSFHNSKQQPKLTKRRYTATCSFKHPSTGKRRRRANSESDSVLPTNFLLGGNIFDPLNLNSLLDEEVNRALNAETPKSSPLPAKSRDPVEILIPRDITDPLNLNSGIAGSSFLVSPFKSSGRKRHRNRHHGGGGAGSGISTTQVNLSESEKSEVKISTSAQLPGVSGLFISVQDDAKESSSFSSVMRDSHNHAAEHSVSSKDEVTSAHMEDATPSQSAGPNQHTSRRKRRRNSGKTEPPVSHSTPTSKLGSGERNSGSCGQKSSFHTPRSGPKGVLGFHQQQPPHSQTKAHHKKFQYGNYNKYYGYRNPGSSEDPRIHVLRQEWFEGKDVLDLGCNSGHMTLYVAKMFRPARILGLDIDGGLIHAARKNIRHYLSELQTQEARRAVQEKKTAKQEEGGGNKCQAGTEKEHSEAENEKAEEAPSGPANAVNDNHPGHTNQKGTREAHSKMDETQRKDGIALKGCSFPVSLRISRGPIAAPPLTETCTVQPGEFPFNVSFVKVRPHPESYQFALV